MPPSAASSTETRLLTEIWKRAYSVGLVRLNLTAKSDAMRLRMQLYNVASTNRKRQSRGEDFDNDLLQASAECAISIPADPLGGWILCIQHRVEANGLADIAAQLGISASDHTPEATAKASLMRLEDLIEPETGSAEGEAALFAPMPAYLRKEAGE